MERQELPKTGESEALNFLRLELDNFKNLEKKVVEVGGQSLVILGRNGSGKSTLIDALCSPLDSKLVPTKPIKEGEESAKIEVVIGNDNKKYIVTLYFTPGNQKGRLVVENDKGETIKSPATFIKSLIGNVSFDPIKWLNESKEKRLATIKNLTGCAKDLDIIKLEIDGHKGTLKAKKDRIKELEAILNNKNFTQEEVEKYSTPVDIESIQAELNSVTKNQATYDGVKKKTDDFASAMATHKANMATAEIAITDAERKIKELQELIESKKAYITDQRTQEALAANKNAEGLAWLNKVTRPSSTEISERLTEATKHNEKCNQIGILATQQKEMIGLKRELGTITTSIEAAEKKRMDKIASSQLPIPGLTFTDDDILLDGIPLEEGGVNTAKIIDISVDIAQALKPNLKAIFIHDGSLLDKQSLRSLIQKIEARGYRAIVEVVSDGDLDIKFSEEYLSN